MSGRKSYKKFREKIRSDPERAARIEEIGEAYGALISLNELRESRGFTQADLARSMGVSQPNISKIERGVAGPLLSTIEGYVEALGGRIEVRAVFPDQSFDIAAPGSSEYAEPEKS